VREGKYATRVTGWVDQIGTNLKAEATEALSTPSLTLSTMPSKSKVTRRQQQDTTAETRLLQLYARFAQLLATETARETGSSAQASAATLSEAVAGQTAEPKLTGAAAKAAAIAKLKMKGGIKKQVDSVTAFKARRGTNKRGTGGGGLGMQDAASKRRRVVTAAPAVVTAALPDRSGTEGGGSRATVFVSGLPETADRDALHEVFGQFGYIIDVREVTGKSFAFVNFRDSASADAAIERMNGAEIHGTVVAASYAREKSRGGDAGGTQSDQPAPPPVVVQPEQGVGGRAAVVYDDF
jgi:hypothetical protein